MATPVDLPTSRQRGSIRRRARCFDVRVSAGTDPSTGERIVLVESVEIEGQGERAERAGLKEAEKLRTKLLADADSLKVARTGATVGLLIERWMELHEIDPTTRAAYESQIRTYIEPNLGDVPLALFVRDTAQRWAPRPGVASPPGSATVFTLSVDSPMLARMRKASSDGDPVWAL